MSCKSLLQLLCRIVPFTLSPEKETLLRSIVNYRLQVCISTCATSCQLWLYSFPALIMLLLNQTSDGLYLYTAQSARSDSSVLVATLPPHFCVSTDRVLGRGSLIALQKPQFAQAAIARQNGRTDPIVDSVSCCGTTASLVHERTLFLSCLQLRPSKHCIFGLPSLLFAGFQTIRHQASFSTRLSLIAPLCQSSPDFPAWRAAPSQPSFPWPNHYSGADDLSHK